MISIVEFDFKQFFTSDASELISTYLTSLKNFMTREGFGNDQIEVVINGIIEFIQEYSLNFNNNKINFSTTLELIEEIGSPTEIIQSLDQKNSETNRDKNMCPYCNYSNTENNNFCEYCGKNISKMNYNFKKENYKIDIEKNSSVKNSKVSLEQKIIDHPYSRGLFLFFPFFVLLFLILSISNNALYGYPDVLQALTGIIIISLIISIIMSLIFGLIIDAFYQKSKSLQFQIPKSGKIESVPIQSFKSSLEQRFIDHPYKSGFLLFLSFFTFVITLLSLTNREYYINSFLDPVTFFITILFSSFGISLIISLILSIIYGLIIDAFFKNSKSIKFQYNKILENYEENVIGGFAMVFLGCTFLCLTLGIFQSQNYALFPLISLIWFIIIFIDFFFLIHFFKRSFRPQGLNLTQLNMLKINIEKINQKKYKEMNETYLIAILIFSFFTILVTANNFNWVQFIIAEIVITILYSLIFNGFLTMRFNSWKTISSYPLK